MRKPRFVIVVPTAQQLQNSGDTSPVVDRLIVHKNRIPVLWTILYKPQVLGIMPQKRRMECSMGSPQYEAISLIAIVLAYAAVLN